MSRYRTWLRHTFIGNLTLAKLLKETVQKQIVLGIANDPTIIAREIFDDYSKVNLEAFIAFLAERHRTYQENRQIATKKLLEYMKTLNKSEMASDAEFRDFLETKAKELILDLVQIKSFHPRKDTPIVDRGSYRDYKESFSENANPTNPPETVKA